MHDLQRNDIAEMSARSTREESSMKASEKPHIAYVETNEQEG